MLTLALIALAARLLADLTSLRLVPIFRAFLFSLIACLLYLGGAPTPAWMGLAVLAIKCGVTAEMMRMLYRARGPLKTRYLFGFSLCAGLLAVALLFLFGFQQQESLINPALVFIRQVVQVFLAGVVFAMAIFSWAYYRNAGFTVVHLWLMSALWIDYAVIGILGYSNGAQWRYLETIWNSVAILTIAVWIATATPTLRSAWRASWGRVVRSFGLWCWVARRRTFWVFFCLAGLWLLAF